MTCFAFWQAFPYCIEGLHHCNMLLIGVRSAIKVFLHFVCIVLVPLPIPVLCFLEILCYTCLLVLTGVYLEIVICAKYSGYCVCRTAGFTALKMLILSQQRIPRTRKREHFVYGRSKRLDHCWQRSSRRKTMWRQLMCFATIMALKRMATYFQSRCWLLNITSKYSRLFV